MTACQGFLRPVKCTIAGSLTKGRMPVWARRVINHLSDSVVAGHEFKQIGERLKDMPNRPQQRADFNSAEGDRKVGDPVSPEHA